MKKGYQFLALLMMMSAAYSQGISVTFKVNTASHPEGVTDSTHTMTVRGTLNGWTETTEGTMVGNGDYYEVTIALADSFTTSHEINYKFVSDNGTGVSWEDAISDRVLALTAGGTIDAGLVYWDDNMPYTATDSIDVFFRVNMEGEIGFVAGTDPVYVAGGVPPLTWGTDSGVALTREGTSFFYSGLGSFHNDSVGVTVPYKFIYDQDGTHWENTATGSDRPVVLSADTTLQFKYFSDTPPSAIDPVTADVVFNVDIAAYETMGIFSVAGDDSMQVRGGFNGWAGTAASDGSDLFLDRVSGTTIYQKSISITDFAGDTDNYKYYIKFSHDDSVAFVAENPYFFADMGYENPAKTGGGNRSFTFTGDPDNAQQLALEYYNGITLAELIPEGTTTALTFTADMRHAATKDIPEFDPAADSVYWVPKDEWAAHVLGYIRDSAEDEKRAALLMTPTTANDSIWTITFDWVGPVPFTLVYVYEYGSAANDYVQEGGGFDAGRFRARYVQPATLDPVTWPATYDVPVDTAGVDPPLVQETPPTGLVLTNEDNFYLPNRFKVGQNYPNPFNPTTSVMFTIPASGDVTFAVYNILGQQVVSHTQAFPAPGTYQFNWNGMNRRGAEAASGIYFYQVKLGDQSVTRKMTLLR
ncbi:T9SS type A sorting domain-containing protein [Candidatus Neomarinimicrobiota bacterium]